MSDPIRWLDETGEASPHERMLLSAGRDLDPPPGAQDKVWAALQLHIGPGGGGGGNGGGGGSGSGASGKTLTNASAGSGSSGASISAAVGSAKAAIAAAAGALAVAGAIAAFVATSTPASPSIAPRVEVAAPTVAEPSPPTPRETATNAESAAETAPVEPNRSPAASAPLPPDAPPLRPATRVSSAKPIAQEPHVDAASETKQERASRLREENRMLGDARAALRNGDSASALKKLEAMGGQFPDGVLAQEREVLAIEALARAGNRSAAAARAAAFLKAHPTSPHAKKLRGFLQ